jgi:hypothetical protein
MKNYLARSRKTALALYLTLLLVAAVLPNLSPTRAQRVIRPSQIKGFLLDTTPQVELPAAAVLTITANTWGVQGLDSNNVNVGPNVFPVGARVCNTGNATATNVSSTFVWDSVNALINLRTGSNSTLTVPSLSAGACTDLYFEVQVTRSSAAYNTLRRYHITVAADTVAPVSTPTPREIFVEKLVSQNRNSVASISLNGVNIPFGGSMNLVVGNTYTIEITGSTATNGYEQLESFINLPNVIFQTLSVTTTYSAPTGFSHNRLYANACGWDDDPMSATYRSCTGPAGVSGGKAGGAVTMTYVVKVLSGGGTSQTLNTLIYDFSGSSYHYNSDLSSSAVIANILQPTAAGVSIDGRIIQRDGAGIRNATVSLMTADGQVFKTVSSAFGMYHFDGITSGQSVVVSVMGRRYTFSPSVRFVLVNDTVGGLDFVAD